MNGSETFETRYGRIQKHALLAGGIGAILCLVGAILNLDQFFRSYLFAYFFWIGVTLGSLAVLMMHHLTGGAWGFVVRRIFEAGVRTLPLMLVLFLPIVLGIQILYAWARPEVVAADEVLQYKTFYLNIRFFLIRTAVYFAAWLGIAFALIRWSRRQDETGDVSLSRRFQLLSGPGLILYVLTATFASIDWVMSLEPRWFSSIFGMLVVVGQVLVTLAFAIAAVNVLKDRPPLAEVISPRLFNDLGNLLLAFVLLWAYLAFSQFLIIWSGNLPEEVTWYLHRSQGGWGWVIVLLLLFHFSLPFAILLSRNAKRRIQVLAAIAVLVVVMRLVDTFWMVTPAFYRMSFHVHWLDFAAFIAIGGVWMALLIQYLKGAPLLPLRDPRMEKVFGHG